MFNDIAKSYWKNNVFKGFYVFLIVFLVAEQLVIAKPFVSKASAIEPISSIKEVIHKNQCPVFYLETDATQELYIAQHIHAMWAGMDLNTPTVNGYTGISKYDLGKKLSKDEIKEMLYESPENPVCIIELNDTHAKLKEIY